MRLKHLVALLRERSRAAVDTPFLILAFFIVCAVALAFFVRHGAYVSSAPGERVAEQVSYGMVSQVDLREILDKAYLRASLDAGASGGDRLDVDMLFSRYPSDWIREYFRARGVHNMSVDVRSAAVPEEQERSYGSVTSLRYGRYLVVISTS